MKHNQLIKCFLILLFLPVNLISCFYSLESVIQKSRERIMLYDTDMYWQGNKVGTVHEFDSDLNEKYKNILIDNALWIARTEKCPDTYQYVYNHITKKNEWKLVSGGYMSTRINTGYEAFDISGKLKNAIFSMTVPEYGCSATNYYFKYDAVKNKILRLYNPHNSLSEKDWGKLMIDEMANFPPKEIKSGKTDYTKKVSEEEFIVNKQKTLQDETEERQSIIHVATGFDTQFYHTASSSPKSARSEIKLKVHPIYMAWVQFDFSYKYFYFNGQYSSNLGLIGGNTETGYKAKEHFNINKAASFIMDLAAGLFGFELNYMVQNFKLGRAKYKIPYYSTAIYPKITYNLLFEMKKREIDVKYHFIWRDIPRLGGMSRKTKIWDLYVGYRYLDYKVPKILYTEKSFSEDLSIIVGESTPQLVKINNHLAGIGTNNYLKAVKPGFNWLFGIECYLGYSKTRMSFYNYYNDGVYINDYKKYRYMRRRIDMVVVDPGGSIGTLINFTTGSIKTGLKIEYKFNAYLLMPVFRASDHGYFNNHLDFFHTISISFDLLF